MKDVEILLRGFAMLMTGAEYRPSMSRFLNRFSRKAQGHADELNAYLETLFVSFVEACRVLPEDTFFSLRTNRFSIALYEAVFTVLCEAPLAIRSAVGTTLDAQSIRALDEDPVFVEASEKASADKVNVDRRLERARAILGA